MAMDKVLLTLSADNIERYCQELARYQARPERRIAAIDALRTFIGVMASPGEQAKPEFAAISDTLSRHFEQARANLLTSQCDLLVQALTERSLLSVVSLYTVLSRDAFWQLLKQATSVLEPSVALQATQWCGDWLLRAKTRSAAVCPYPDTIDFKAAGIEVAEYTAMQDILHFFAALHGKDYQI